MDTAKLLLGRPPCLGGQRSHGRRTQPPRPGALRLATPPGTPHAPISEPFAPTCVCLQSISPCSVPSNPPLAEDVFKQASDAATPGTIAICADRLAAELQHVSSVREYRLSDISFDASSPRVSTISEQEERLLATIHDLAPTAAHAYRQAILDTLRHIKGVLPWPRQ